MALFPPGFFEGLNNSAAIDRQKAKDALDAQAKKQAMEFQAAQMEDFRRQSAQRQRTEELAGQVYGKVYGPPGANGPQGQQPPAPPPGQSSQPAAPMPPPQAPQMYSQPPMRMPQPVPGAPQPMPMVSAAGQQAAGQQPPGPPPPYRTREAAMQPRIPPAQPAQAPAAPPPVSQPQGGGAGSGRLSVQGIVQSAIQAGANPEEVARVVATMNPMVKEQLSMDLAAQKAQLGQANQYIKALEFGLHQKAEETKEKREAELEKHDRALESRMRGRGAAGSGEGGGMAAPGKPLSEAQQDTEDAKAWQYIDTRQLPYRKGKGGPNDPNEKVMARAAAIAKGLHMSMEELAAQPAEFKANAKALDDRVKYSAAVEQLQGTLNKQANLVDSLLDKGASGSGSPVLNKWLQAGRKATGDPDVVAFDAALTGLAREHQRVLTSPLSNAQLHASSTETADRLVNTAQTPEQIRAVIKVMRQEAANGKAQAAETVSELRSRLSGKSRGSTGSQGWGAIEVVK